MSRKTSCRSPQESLSLKQLFLLYHWLIIFLLIEKNCQSSRFRDFHSLDVDELMRNGPAASFGPLGKKILGSTESKAISRFETLIN